MSTYPEPDEEIRHRRELAAARKPLTPGTAKRSLALFRKKPVVAADEARNGE